MEQGGCQQLDATGAEAASLLGLLLLMLFLVRLGGCFQLLRLLLAASCQPN
jgi:hypothetical protein